jgi:hypothetical protein
MAGCLQVGGLSLLAATSGPVHSVCALLSIAARTAAQLAGL